MTWTLTERLTATPVPGWIIIDRSGAHFGTILNFLRDESCVLPDTVKGVYELLAEAKYYCISELADSCEKALPKRDVDPICRVPLITSAKEEQVLIGSSTKVRRDESVIVNDERVFAIRTAPHAKYCQQFVIHHRVC